MIEEAKWVDGVTMSYLDHGPIVVIVEKVRGGWSGRFEVKATKSIVKRSEPRERDVAKEIILAAVADWYNRTSSKVG